MDQYQQSRQPHQEDNSYEIPSLTNHATQFFGGNGIEASPTVANFDFSDIHEDGNDQDGGHDESNDAKRRRIARVCIIIA